MLGITTAIQTQPNYGFQKWGSLSLSASNSSSKTITLITHGRPVFLGIGGNNNPSSSAWCRAYIIRDSTELAFVTCDDPGSSTNRPFSVFHIDTPTAGTYVYKGTVQTHSGTINYSESGANEAPWFFAFELE